MWQGYPDESLALFLKHFVFYSYEDCSLQWYVQIDWGGGKRGVRRRVYLGTIFIIQGNSDDGVARWDEHKWEVVRVEYILEEELNGFVMLDVCERRGVKKYTMCCVLGN